MSISQLCELHLSKGVQAYKKEGPKFVHRLVAKQKPSGQRIMKARQFLVESPPRTRQVLTAGNLQSSQVAARAAETRRSCGPYRPVRVGRTSTKAR